MQLQRNEIMTGLLVIGTIAVVAFLLVLLGAPGLFRPLVTYKIYFDNAAGIKQGAPVMLAGRKIGQVQKLYSPVSPEEEKRAEEVAAAVKLPEASTSLPGEASTKGGPSPMPGAPRFEVRIDVQVDKSAKVYRDAKARMLQLGLLGDMAIDITQGTEKSGRAKDGEIFAGERTPDLGEAAARMLEVIKPVAAEATNTMKDLQQTAQNLNRLTDENSELTLALGQFKTFGQHLSDLTAPDSALSHSLANIERISTSLTENDNIEVTLRNLRNSSEKLKVATTELQPAGENIKQFSETIKTQPWRLIWPTTKKYAEASPTPAPAQGAVTVRKTARAKPRPRATPAERTSQR
jgi:ABC-type transporter Mla subunit MlaD